MNSLKVFQENQFLTRKKVVLFLMKKHRKQFYRKCECDFTVNNKLEVVQVDRVEIPVTGQPDGISWYSSVVFPSIESVLNRFCSA